MKEQSSLAKRMALLLGVTAAGLVSLLGSGGGEVARPFNASCTSGSFRLRAVETQLTGPAGMATSEAPKANVTCEVVRGPAFWAMWSARSRSTVPRSTGSCWQGAGPSAVPRSASAF